MKKKRNILIALMIVYACVCVPVIGYLFGFKKTMHVTRPADGELFFEVFPDAEDRPLSAITCTPLTANMDLLRWGKGDYSCMRLYAEEEEKIRSILSATRITYLEPGDPLEEKQGIGFYPYRIGFRKYAMHLYREDGVVGLCMEGGTDRESACYRIEDEKQAELLQEAVDTAIYKYSKLVPEEFSLDDVARKIHILNELGEWESTHGFSMLYVPVGVFAAGELLLALILWRTVRKKKK